MTNSENEIHITIQIDEIWEEWTDWDRLVPEDSDFKANIRQRSTSKHTRGWRLLVLLC